MVALEGAASCLVIAGGMVSRDDEIGEGIDLLRLERGR